jgi:hypothetical protein
MLRRVTLVGTDVSQHLNASIIMVPRIDEIGTISVTTTTTTTTDSSHSDDGDANFLRNVGSFKSHTPSHPRRSYFPKRKLFTNNVTNCNS